MTTNFRNYLSIIGLSILVFLLTCWTAKFDGAAPYWAEGISFFALSWFVARKEEKNNLSIYGIAFALILGRILLEIPIRTMDFVGTVGSILIPVNSILAIILGLCCYRSKNSSVYILSIVIEILMATFVQETWYNIFIK